MIKKIYVIDYDSITFVRAIESKEISRKRESLLFDNKQRMIKVLSELTGDECIENITVSVCTLDRDNMDLKTLLKSISEE